MGDGYEMRSKISLGGYRYVFNAKKASFHAVIRNGHRMILMPDFQDDLTNAI